MIAREALSLAVAVFKDVLGEPSPAPELLARHDRERLTQALGVLLALRTLAPREQPYKVIAHRREQPCPGCGHASFCEDCGVCEQCGFCRPEPGEVH